MAGGGCKSKLWNVMRVRYLVSTCSMLLYVNAVLDMAQSPVATATDVMYASPQEYQEFLRQTGDQIRYEQQQSARYQQDRRLLQRQEHYRHEQIDEHSPEYIESLLAGEQIELRRVQPLRHIHHLQNTEVRHKNVLQSQTTAQTLTEPRRQHSPSEERQQSRPIYRLPPPPILPESSYDFRFPDFRETQSKEYVHQQMFEQHLSNKPLLSHQLTTQVTYPNQRNGSLPILFPTGFQPPLARDKDTQTRVVPLPPLSPEFNYINDHHSVIPPSGETRIRQQETFNSSPQNMTQVPSIKMSYTIHTEKTPNEVKYFKDQQSYAEGISGTTPQTSIFEEKLKNELETLDKSMTGKDPLTAQQTMQQQALATSQEPQLQVEFQKADSQQVYSTGRPTTSPVEEQSRNFSSQMKEEEPSGNIELIPEWEKTEENMQDEELKQRQRELLQKQLQRLLVQKLRERIEQERKKQSQNQNNELSPEMFKQLLQRALLQSQRNQTRNTQTQQRTGEQQVDERKRQRQLRKERLEKQQELLRQQLLEDEQQENRGRHQRQQNTAAAGNTTRPKPTSIRDLFTTPSCVDPPIQCPHSRIQFYLYTRSTQNNPELLDVSSPASLDKSQFNNKNPTKIIIHGFGGGRNYSPSTDLRRAYFTRGEYNIVIVDYSSLVVEPCLSQIEWSPRFCAQCIAQLVSYLASHPRGTAPDKLHLLGYSVGAHVAGLVANYMSRGKLGRITGLDPTIIFYMGSNRSRDLDPSDAHFVDVIHTGAGVLGQWGPNGHVDFYVNGGTTQPGCQQNSLLKTLSCDHTKVTPYYIESINSKEGFWASPCTNQVLYFLGFCQPRDEEYILMGEDVPRSARGLYYLTTNARKPYAKGFPGRRKPVVQGGKA